VERDNGPERRSRLFTVRLWSEAVGEHVERRGSVRTVDSGAFRHFREWSELMSVLAEQLDECRPKRSSSYDEVLPNASTTPRKLSKEDS
jgi:hypothetical protein